MKKRWIFIPAALAALAVAITAGAIMAQEATPTPAATPAATATAAPTATPTPTFAGRVATILGLTEQAVSDAMEQAKSEMRDAELQAKFDALVEKGMMTRADADSYLAWLRTKPDVDFGEKSEFGFGKGRGHFGGWGKGWGKAWRK